jgi:hypothetical protein
VTSGGQKSRVASSLLLSDNGAERHGVYPKRKDTRVSLRDQVLDELSREMSRIGDVNRRLGGFPQDAYRVEALAGTVRMLGRGDGLDETRLLYMAAECLLWVERLRLVDPSPGELEEFLGGEAA